MIKTLVKFVELTDEIEAIIENGLSWKDKYHLVFSQSLSRKISELGISLDYYDPDTSYEEDVMAYYRAVKEKAGEFKRVIEGRPVADSGDKPPKSGPNSGNPGPESLW